MEGIQKHILHFIKVDQLIIAHMFQVQFLKSSAYSEYNAACTEGMSLEHFMILNNWLLNKDPGVVPEQSTIIILDRK